MTRIIVDYNPDHKIGAIDTIAQTASPSSAGHQDRRLRGATQVRERRERDKPDGQRIRRFYRLFADQAVERVALGLAHSKLAPTPLPGLAGLNSNYDEGASQLPRHLSALIGSLHGPPDLGRNHDKYLAYPDRDESGGAESA